MSLADPDMRCLAPGQREKCPELPGDQDNLSGNRRASGAATRQNYFLKPLWGKKREPLENYQGGTKAYFQALNHISIKI